jgi:hypothetical protein
MPAWNTAWKLLASVELNLTKGLFPAWNTWWKLVASVELNLTKGLFHVTWHEQINSKDIDYLDTMTEERCK